MHISLWETADFTSMKGVVLQQRAAGPKYAGCLYPVHKHLCPYLNNSILVSIFKNSLNNMSAFWTSTFFKYFSVKLKLLQSIIFIWTTAQITVFNVKGVAKIHRELSPDSVFSSFFLSTRPSTVLFVFSLLLMSTALTALIIFISKKKFPLLASCHCWRCSAGPAQYT